MAGTVANSTFQVKGSVAANILTTAAALTLDETNYTVILTANANITLPAANTCIGRIYIIKKTANGNSTISNFISNTATATTTIARGVVQLQSDGTSWQQIN
jgi:tRNA(Phe) wybutosine-synthesizing methylase Tyw3